MLFYSHVGIAAITASPELMLDEAEAKAIAGATATMLDAFDVRPDPRVEAVVGFVTTVAPIYGTKLLQRRNRLKKEKPAKSTAAANGGSNGPIVDMQYSGLGGGDSVQ
jgi:hypothetical protein